MYKISSNVNKKQIDDYEKKCRVRTKHVDELFLTLDFKNLKKKKKLDFFLQNPNQKK